MGTNDVLGGLSWLLLSPPALDGHKSYNVIVCHVSSQDVFYCPTVNVHKNFLRLQLFLSFIGDMSWP